MLINIISDMEDILLPNFRELSHVTTITRILLGMEEIPFSNSRALHPRVTHGSISSGKEVMPVH
jgi:hypothetical protein